MYRAGGNVKATLEISEGGGGVWSPPPKCSPAFQSHTIQIYYVIPEAFYSQYCPFASLPLLAVHICKEGFNVCKTCTLLTTNGIGGSESADAISLSSLFFQPGTIAGEPYLSLRSFARSRYFNYEDHIHFKCYHLQSCIIRTSEAWSSWDFSFARFC